MTDAVRKIVIDRDRVALTWEEDDLSEARAIQVCLRHLMREAQDLRLDMTVRVLSAAMEAIDLDLGGRAN